MRIFIDLDGVIADFFGGVCDYLIKNREEEIKKVTLDRDFIDLLSNGKSDDFWAQINEDFWSQLQILPGAQRIIDIAHDFTPDVAFLTSHASRPSAAAGKVNWVKNHFPAFSKKLIICNCKHLCAGPNNVLLDDWERQINQFKAYGGCGILIPQPWNSLANQVKEHDTYDWLVKKLDIIKRGPKL